MGELPWEGAGKGREVRLNRAARLAALLLLDDMGLLEGHTLQAIADALGEGNDRSTIMRDKRLLPEVRRRRDAARRSLRTGAAGIGPARERQQATKTGAARSRTQWPAPTTPPSNTNKAATSRKENDMSSRLQYELSIVGAPRWIALSQVPAAILTPGWAISGRQVTYRPLTWEGDLPAAPVLARLTPGPVSTAVGSYVASATLSESVAISVEEYDLLRRIPGPILPHRPNGVMGENGGTINAWSLAKQFVPLSRGTIPGDAWAPRRWWREYGDAARAYAREHHLRGPRLDEVAVAVAPASTVARYIQGRNDKAAWNMAHATEMERIRPLLSRLLSLGAIVADGVGEMRRLVVVW